MFACNILISLAHAANDEKWHYFTHNRYAENNINSKDALQSQSQKLTQCHLHNTDKTYTCL